MRFLPFLTLSLLPLATHAAPTGIQVAAVFNDVAIMSDTLRITVEGITPFNAPFQGFKIAAGFLKIIDKISASITVLQSAAQDANRAQARDLSDPAPQEAKSAVPFPDEEAKIVVAALTTFVKIHQALLNVVIGKHGILTLIPFFEPIRRALVSLEKVVDMLAFLVIGLIPTQAPAAQTQFDKLSVTLKLTIVTYS
ncbi:hypothetical protein FN846DRAFT_931004 [Sphaerosporella brunnea]|uniref:Hydrophobic surface binding protein A-domain-containing protein n=1 Tax=Sphaerosporella brunnea TaxID=1250544 RepID=A0A5J5F8F2_9PEZI|nr:hypothetical protein FN846DRAFT_931004 [Sphaerosporella brunnea]